MNIERVGSRGTLFTYDDLDGLPTTVYLIEGPIRWFVIDTFLGPQSMAPVMERISRESPGKPVVVFNTHYHWDHVWGNCAFPAATIVSHRLTRGKMSEVGQKELEAYGQYKKGKVDLVLPQLTFDSRLRFEKDGVELFHSPGHTADSSSCLDLADGILLAGDNMELPLPFLYWDDLEAYRKTLESYKLLRASRTVAGHCHRVTAEALGANIRYLEDFQKDQTKDYEAGEAGPSHRQNLAVMSKLRENKSTGGGG